MKVLISFFILTYLVSAQQADDLYRQGAEKFFAVEVSPKLPTLTTNEK